MIMKSLLVFTTIVAGFNFITTDSNCSNDMGDNFNTFKNHKKSKKQKQIKQAYNNEDYYNNDPRLYIRDDYWGDYYQGISDYSENDEIYYYSDNLESNIKNNVVYTDNNSNTLQSIKEEENEDENDPPSDNGYLDKNNNNDIKEISKQIEIQKSSEDIINDNNLYSYDMFY